MPVLKKIESIINNSPFYNIIRFNPLTDLIIETKTRKTRKAIAFYSSFLDPAGTHKLVFDIGANKGNKVKAFLKMGFEVIAVEPERKALSTIRWRYGHNKKVTILDNGVSDKEATLTIHIAANRSGLNTVSEKWVDSLEKERSNRWHKKHAFKKKYDIKAVTLNQLFQQYGVPYFIKIDVEGYEKSVIKGMSQLPSFLSFETNLPEFLEETIECIRHIHSINEKVVFNYSIEEKIELETWISGPALLEILKDPAIRYMEIICKNRI
jgi:FkbM family methyltransferase